MNAPDTPRDEPRSPVGLAAVAGVILVLALVGALAWLASDVPEPDPAPSPFAEAVRLPEVWAVSASLPASTVQVARVQPPLPIASSPPAGHLDVCGIGVVKEADWMGPARIQSMAASVAAARERVVGALKASPDETGRALGLALESMGGAIVTDEVVACTGPGCPEEPERIESRDALARRLAANRKPRDALARLALTTRSPEVYGLAWGLCSTVGARDDSSACRMLSAEQWARLDPANAVPWMSVMEQARARGDQAAADEALYRVSQARTVNAGTGRFAALLLDRLPASVGPLEALELAAETFSIELQAPAGWYGSLRQACSAAAQRDGNRQQQCQAIAEGLWRFGSSPLELAVAVQIGAASGWPAERVRALEDERVALGQAGAAAVGEVSMTCESLRNQARHLQQVGRAGEVAVQRAALLASGHGVAHWADVHRATLRQAQAAADAASAVVPTP
ncbi:MAG: hypothetical protein ACM32J_01850 [Rhizobacter sp.]